MRGRLAALVTGGYLVVTATAGPSPEPQKHKANSIYQAVSRQLICGCEHGYG